MFESVTHLSADEPQTNLAGALEKNEAAFDSVERSASELLVIHAVLKHEIPDHLQTGEIAQALQRTDDLETKISETAIELAQVNMVLAQEIDGRADLERELAATKSELVQVKEQLT